MGAFSTLFNSPAFVNIDRTTFLRGGTIQRLFKMTFRFLIRNITLAHQNDQTKTPWLSINIIIETSV